MNSISIPKKFFEDIFFEQGGKKTAQILTGSKQFEEKIPDEINANVEDDEWIKDSEGLREVVGEKHSNGGVDVHLEDGAKVLSDKGTLGKSLAKELGDKYDVKLKQDNTYAEALDKIQVKIGLNTLNLEQEKLIEKLEYQEKNVKDENTLSANIEVLSGKIKNVEDKKRPLIVQSEEVFNYLFEKQEASKPKTTEVTNTFADGGQQNPPPFRVANVYEDWNAYKHQNEIPGIGSGNFGTIDKTKTITEIQRLFPKTASTYFKDGNILPNDSKAFQQDIQRYYYNLDEAVKKLYGEESDKYKQFKTQLDQDKFTDNSVKTDVKSFDGKFGNFTSTRPNFELELLPEDVHKKVKDAGVNTVGELKEKFPEDYSTYVESLNFNIPEDAWLGKKTVQVPVDSKAVTDVVSTPSQVGSNADSLKAIDTGNEGTRYGVMAMPDQTPSTPSSIQSHLKTNRRYERLDFTGISAEQQLVELNKLTERAQENLDMMPPQQRASLSANILATQADQTNKVLSQVNQFNAQGQQQIDNMNAQIQMQENNANAQDALSFEQRQMLAEAKTEADFNNFYNQLQQNNLNSYSFINNANLMNSMYDHFQLTDRGVEQKGINPQFSNVGQSPINQRETAIQERMRQIEASKTIDKEAKERLKNNK